MARGEAGPGADALPCGHDRSGHRSYRFDQGAAPLGAEKQLGDAAELETQISPACHHRHDTDDPRRRRRVRDRHRLFGAMVLHRLQALPQLRLRRPRPVQAAVGRWPLARLGQQHLVLRPHVDHLQHGVRLSARRLHGPAHPAGRPVPLDLPLSLRHVADRHRPRLAMGARPQSRPAGGAPQLGLVGLQLRPARQFRDRSLRTRRGGHLAGLRA